MRLLSKISFDSQYKLTMNTTILSLLTKAFNDLHILFCACFLYVNLKEKTSFICPHILTFKSKIPNFVMKLTFIGY